MNKLYDYMSRMGYVLAHLPQGVWRYVLVLVAVSSLASTKALAQDPGVGGTKAGFEIDADFQSGFIPGFWSGAPYTPNTTTFGDDWSKGLTGTGIGVLKQVNGVSVPGKSELTGALWQVDGNSGPNSLVAEGSTFSGTSNKNGDNIAAGQKPYLIQLGGSTPQKNDITNTYLYGKQVGTPKNLWLFYGAETRSVNGASYVDFEYNQAGAKVVPNGTQFNLVGNGTVGGRTVGDILLVINYTGGGNKPVVGIRTWEANAKWSAEKILPAEAAFVTTNTTNVASVAPNMSFTGDGAYSNITGALQFVEGGVNITALNIPSFNPCNPASTVTVKTRSSPSYTSELKDYDILNFSALPPSSMTPLANQTVCPGGSAEFSTTVTGDGALGVNVQWFLGNSTTPISNNSVYTITASGQQSKLTITNIAAADAGVYKAVLTQATCGNPSTTAELKLKDATAATPLGPLVLCPKSSATFSTTASGTAPFTYVWKKDGTVIPGATGNSYNIASVTADDAGKYTVEVTGECGMVSRSADLTVNPIPTADAGANPAAQCFIEAGNTFLLKGSGVNGTPLWTVKSKGANQTVVITNEKTFEPSVKVSGGSGIVTLLLTVTSTSTPPCGTATSEVAITVNPNPTIQNPAVGAICAGTTSAALSYGGVSNGANQYKIVWSSPGLTSMTEFAALPASPITINNTGALAAGTYNGTIYVKNSITSCESAGDAIKLVVNPNPTADAGANPAAQCFIEAGNTFSLKGSGANGTPLWTVFSNPNNLKVTITSEKTFEPSVSVVGVGTVTLRLTVTSSFTPSCGAKFDDVDVTVSPKPGPPATRYIHPECYEATFKVEVLSPEIGAIYTIVNFTDGGHKVDITAEDDGTGKAKPVVFANRVPGTGYSVTATLGKCVTEADVCGVKPASGIKAVLTTKAPENSEQDKSSEMTAYPVPFTDNTTLEFKSVKDEDYVINLYDLKGTLVKQLKSGKAKTGEITRIEIDGRSMAESMYLVRKVSKSGVSTVKLLKSR